MATSKDYRHVPTGTLAVLAQRLGKVFASSATWYDTPPTFLADGGVENVNTRVDDIIGSGVLRRLLAMTEIAFSNSMIESWWRTLEHQWLYLNTLDSLSSLRKLVSFYVLCRSRHKTYYADVRITPTSVVESRPLVGTAGVESA